MQGVSRRTSKTQQLVLESLRTQGSFIRAAKVAAISRTALSVWRRDDPEFSLACEEAQQEYIEKLEREADRRGVEGTPRPVFFQGEECGQTREYSDNLLMFRLKALAPEKYRDIVETRHSGEVGLALVDRARQANARIEEIRRGAQRELDVGRTGNAAD
jgi:hypothetical protein